jgi:thiamine biosynthesis protein ThiS
MKITLNGAPKDLADGSTMATLLSELGLSGKPVVVEKNQIALLPKETESAALAEGDIIEIVQITAGG